MIAQFEGFESKPYPDPGTGGKPYTIGYGTTVYPDGKAVTMQDPPITKEKALECLRDHVNRFIAPELNQRLPDLQQHQFDALCSFIYNLGMGNFKASSLLLDIKRRADNDVITADFNKWVKAAGKVMAGLVKRRAAEARVYCDGLY